MGGDIKKTTPFIIAKKKQNKTLKHRQTDLTKGIQHVYTINYKVLLR